MKRLLFLAFAVALAFPLSAQKRAFTIEDLYRVKNIAGLALSPDGRTLAFTVATSDLPHAKRSTKIWLMDADGGNLRQVTNGDADSSPAVSPDAPTLAFAGSNNLSLLPLGGGEPRQLTSISTGVSDPLWSPN